MTEDIVRVLRILEYVGPRSQIEDILTDSIQEMRVTRQVTIKAATIGIYPEILEKAVEDKKEDTDS